MELLKQCSNIPSSIRQLHSITPSVLNRMGMMVSSILVLGSLSMSANAMTLISNNTYLEYELPESIQKQCAERQNCPEIEVKYLNSNQRWINDSVNKRVNYFVMNSQPTGLAPVTTPATDKQVKAGIDAFVNSQFAEAIGDSSLAYNMTIAPEYLGHVKLGQAEDFELFEINSYSYTGGAHGMPFSEFLIFNPNTKTQVKLADMLQNGKKPRFKALAYDAYKAWVKTVDNDVSSYEKNWPFTLSNNVTLTDKGVDIRYQHYEIGPYAYGMPTLNIAYSKLENVFKPDFLPK